MKKKEEEKKSKKHKYFITGGGTGGHIYPALAVANELKKRPDTQLFYIGNPNNAEYKIFTDAKINFLPVKITAMPRKAGFAFAGWLIQLGLAILKVFWYLIKYKPYAVFATGGYVSAPAVAAAALLNVDLMIHDCDACPGIVSRLGSKRAKIISVAFEEAKNTLNSKNIRLNGNPVREEFSDLTKEKARKDLQLNNKKTLLIMGGSQGAKSINDAICTIVPNFILKYDLQIIHQTGKKNYDEALKEWQNNYTDFDSKVKSGEMIVKPYFEQMYTCLKAADIVISRAGALSLAEISACELPSILIPYPYAAAGHQAKNAAAMQNTGAAICVKDDENLNGNLKNALESLLDNNDKMKKMSAAAKSWAKPDATQKIVEQLVSMKKNA